MNAYLITNGQEARVFDENFKEVIIDGAYMFSIIGNNIVVETCGENSIGHKRFDLIEKIDFETKEQANNFINTKRALGGI